MNPVFVEVAKRCWPTTKVVTMDVLERVVHFPMPPYYYDKVRAGAVPYLINETVEGICAGIRFGSQDHQYISLFIDQKKAQIEWEKANAS